MNLSNIRKNGALGLFLVDFLMVLLLAVNLAWILFDWLFAWAPIRSFLFELSPAFTLWYQREIAPEFILYDLAFVGVFFIEFMLRWIRAIWRKTFHRWFFFPFVHWYDLIGLIPIAGFRIFRVLRVISIAYRLHRVGAVDLSEFPLVKFLLKYYGIIMQELTDRVAINLIGEVQEEVRHGGPVVDRIVDEVVRPHKEDLVEWLAHRVETVAESNYERYRGDIRRYVRKRINHALAGNKEFQRLEQIPMFGSMIRETVENAVSDMVFTVVRDMMQDLASERNRPLLNESADVLFDAMVLKEENSTLSSMVVDTVDRSLEIVKQQIRIQKWKIRDLAEDEEDFRRRMREELHRGTSYAQYS